MRQVALAAACGAAVTALGLWATTAVGPGVSFEMDRSFPASMAAGFYAAERAGQETWIWIAPSARLTLRGLDRGTSWTCALRFRGSRPSDVVQPRVAMSVDGLPVGSLESANEFQTLTVEVPAAEGRRGVVLGIAADAPFLPPGDPRELGVMVDRLACDPARVATPAGVVLGAGMVAGGLLAAAAVLAGAPLAWAVGLALLLAVVQSVALGAGFAPFTGYPATAAWLAAAVSVGLVVAARVPPMLRGRPLSAPATLVLVVSAAAVYGKLLGVLHPSKPIVDALFHAHRLEWVLSGRFYFTQVMPNGVEFPYAIALYLVAAPWSLFTSDLVSLLRVVTSVAEAIAGGLLYVMVVRVRGDRAMGVLAVVLFHLVPVAWPVVGNANLTNAFGQNVALAAVAAAVVLPLSTSRPGALATVILLTSAALLSHVSTFGLAGATLTFLAIAYWSLGGPSLGRPGVVLLACVGVAAVVAVGGYWAHFGETYQTLVRARAEAEPVAAASAAAASGGLGARLATALSLGLNDLGWPMLVLAAIGLWRLVASADWRDRLGLAVVAWGAAYLLFLAFGVLAPVSGSYERYAAEFIGRVDLAVYPAVVLLGAAGAVRLWRSSLAGRAGAALLVVGVALAGAEQWWRWIE